MTKATKATKRGKPRGKTAPTGSVVPTKYREQYEDGSCGDDLAVRLRKHVETNDGTIGVAKLRALAEANGVWSASYEKLNPGLQRMTIGNKLRALVRHGKKIMWGRS